MNTPICDFVADYKRKNTLRLHMPGHKGRELIGFEGLDITEIDGADVLYSAKGIIKESEENASSLFGTGRTIYSAEGSSLSIRAMLYLSSLWGRENDKDQVVLAARNAHRVFMSACALLDLEAEWLYGEDNTLISCNITARTLEDKLDALEKKGVSPFAVYLTSPDYLGNMLDIRALAEVCHKRNILCLVDNAHGAYLGFLKPSCHPIHLGADMSADSAHKTLPALTGAAYLHISRNAPKLVFGQAENAMSLFASTSPSYLILQSLDAVNKYLFDGYSQRLADFAEKVKKLKARLMAYGYELVGDEPLKITLRTKRHGYFGVEIGERLLEKGIVCEFCDKDFCVMMFTLEISDTELARLEAELLNISAKEPILEAAPDAVAAERVMSIRSAMISECREVKIGDCVGEVLANAAISCPPAVPILVSGERITDEAVKSFKYYGIDSCFVVR